MTLGANSGSSKFENNELEKNQTQFTLPLGLPRLLRMPFILKKALNTFKYDMNVNTVYNHLAVCTPIPVRRCHLLQVGKRAPEPSTEWTETTVERKFIIGTEKLLLLRVLNQLIWSCNSAGQTWHSDESDLRDQWTTNPYKRDWDQIIPRSLQRI